MASTIGGSMPGATRYSAPASTAARACAAVSTVPAPTTASWPYRWRTAAITRAASGVENVTSTPGMPASTSVATAFSALAGSGARSTPRRTASCTRAIVASMVMIRLLGLRVGRHGHRVKRRLAGEHADHLLGGGHPHAVDRLDGLAG